MFLLLFIPTKNSNYVKYRANSILMSTLNLWGKNKPKQKTKTKQNKTKQNKKQNKTKQNNCKTKQNKTKTKTQHNLSCNLDHLRKDKPKKQMSSMALLFPACRVKYIFYNWFKGYSS